MIGQLLLDDYNVFHDANPLDFMLVSWHVVNEAEYLRYKCVVATVRVSGPHPNAVIADYLR